MAKLITEKQLRFIELLRDERKTSPTEVGDALNSVAGNRALTQLGRREASNLITLLKNIPRDPRPGQASYPSAEPPEGVHYVEAGDGSGLRILKVVRSKRSGKLYVKVLLPERHSWEYDGIKRLGKLGPHTVLTPEKAAEFGKHYGVCANCGKDLTDEKSVERGIGPVCYRNILAAQQRAAEAVAAITDEDRQRAKDEALSRRASQYAADPEPEPIPEPDPEPEPETEAFDVEDEIEEERRVGRTIIPASSILAQKFGR